jgi:hypothetical protein
MHKILNIVQGLGERDHAYIDTLILQNFLIEVSYTDRRFVINLKGGSQVLYDAYCLL